MVYSKSIDENTSFYKKYLNADYFKLFIQIVLGILAILPLGSAIVYVLRFKLQYKVRNLKEIRKTYRELTKSRQPILICPNHLTMIDSVILVWAFGSMSWYFFNYRKLTWNVPAVENFKNTRLRSIITYLSKCIPVDRKGSKEHHDHVLWRTIYLMKRLQVFTYFPEGGRSRTARIDTENIRYGVGKLAAEIPNLKVICVYMRGDGQKDYSEIPQKGETLNISFKVIYPKTEYTGLRAHRDLSTQIIMTLKDMEDEYFASHQSGQ
ncbi:MAG: 1-acyl-sn-glycerol-3-phosphate acyltransferase [Spirochaetia bacterium]|nr:1-acyl-sn-glycerol-3-phosphate acyltransferase [Spirochaetia bacterium]